MIQVACDKCKKFGINCRCQEKEHYLDFFNMSYYAYLYKLNAEEFASMLLSHNVKLGNILQ